MRRRLSSRTSGGATVPRIASLRPSPRYLATVGVVALAYFGTAKGGLALAYENSSVTAVWAPTGLALAALVLGGRRLWPGVALGAALANSWTGVPLVTVLGITAGNTLEAVVGAYLLGRVPSFRPSLDRARDVVALAVLAAGLSTLVSASVGVASLYAGHAVSSGALPTAWRTWWLGDLCGDLLVAPFVLVFGSDLRRNVRPRPERVLEALVLLVALAGVSWLVFSSHVSRTFVIFPLMIWATLRFRQRGVVAASLIVAGVAADFTARGMGPFVAGTPDGDLLLSQAFVGVTALLWLLLAAVTAEREHAEEKLTRAYGELEATVREQTDVLRRSQAWLTEAQGIAHLGTWEWDVRGGTVRWSDELYRIYGVTRDEFQPSFPRYLEMVHPDDRARVEATIDRAYADHQPFALQERIVRPDGSVRVLTSQGKVFVDGDGRSARMLGVCQDVTDRQRAQEELRESALRFQAVTQSVNDAVVSADQDGKIVFWNESAEAIFGYTPDEAIGRPLTLLMPERHRAVHRQGFARFLESGEARVIGRTVELEGRRKDGSEFPLELSLGHWTHGDRSSFTAVIRDTTERKRAEQELGESRERFRLLVDGVQDYAIFMLDPDGRVVTWNEGAKRIKGYDPEEIVGQHHSRFYTDEEVRQELPQLALAVAAAHGRYEGEGWRVRKDGSRFVAHVVLTALRDSAGELRGFSKITRDVTELKRAERAVNEAEERFRATFDEAPIGIALMDLEGRFRRVNRALCEIVGRPRNVIEITGIDSIAHPDDVAEVRSQLELLRAGAISSYKTEKRLVHASGHSVWVAVQATLLRDADGKPAHFLTQILDVSERRTYEEKLRYMADHDPLTGSLNRRSFEREIESHLGRAHRYGAYGAALILDVDHLKDINDSLGHQAGDELIRRVARALGARLRESDVLARLSGDEFAVLLPAADAEGARKVAQALVEAVRELDVQTREGNSRTTTASVGVAMIEEGLSREDVMVNADLAMYDAKNAGRNRIAVYSPDPEHDRRKERLSWVERIRGALEHDRFTLLAQPIVDLSTGRVSQHELLLRMRDETGDLIPPAAFLDIAERLDLVQAIDRWVVRSAIGILDGHERRGRPVTVEVNLSGRSLGDPELLDLVEAELERTRIPPERLIFEVTETAAAANMPAARRFGERLSQLGCRFALDDFGAGFGSFYYLKHLPFDFLKIDGEFVRNSRNSRTDQLVIKAVVDLARGLNKKTIAEIVGDEETVDLLAGLGVDYAQGYHLGRPRPFEEIDAGPFRDAPVVG
jgi:diguanylate cyclase (GGDEF)-like protein/PAS domain S-box-containing protein